MTIGWPPPAATGWPTPADLSAKLGLRPGDDTDMVTAALAAAQADAISLAGLDAVAGVTDWGQWEAVLGLGVWWYQDRNRPSDFTMTGPYASTSPSRTRMVQILSRGKTALA